MLSIKDLSTSQELDRAAMGAVTGGTGIPGFFQTNVANDLYDFLGVAYQKDATVITNADNHGSWVDNIVDNDKTVNF